MILKHIARFAVGVGVIALWAACGFAGKAIYGEVYFGIGLLMPIIVACFIGLAYSFGKLVMIPFGGSDGDGGWEVPKPPPTRDDARAERLKQGIKGHQGTKPPGKRPSSQTIGLERNAAQPDAAATGGEE